MELESNISRVLFDISNKNEEQNPKKRTFICEKKGFNSKIQA